MSTKEAEDKSLRELVRHSINMMEDNKKAMLEHKAESTAFRDYAAEKLNDLSLSVATIETHAEYTKKAITAHEEEIAKMKANENKVKGVLWLLGILGLGSIVNYFKGS